MKRPRLMLPIAVVFWCGVLLRVTSARAVAGDTETHPLALLHAGFWSWLVALMLKPDDGIHPHHHFCAGSLISDRWVLTASHCFDNEAGGNNASKWIVRFSDNGFKMEEDSRSDLAVGIERIVRHPHYSRDAVRGDITLLRLDRHMMFLTSEPESKGGHGRSVAVLPTHDSIFPPGTICSTIGWKCPHKGRGEECTAYEVDMPVRRDSTCEFFQLLHWTKTVCAGRFFHSARPGVCQGDSGGPLVCVDETQGGKRVLAGLLSFVHDERPLNHPAGFTDVLPYLDWIRNEGHS